MKCKPKKLIKRMRKITKIQCIAVAKKKYKKLFLSASFISFKLEAALSVLVLIERELNMLT